MGWLSPLEIIAAVSAASSDGSAGAATAHPAGVYRRKITDARCSVRQSLAFVLELRPPWQGCCEGWHLSADGLQSSDHKSAHDINNRLPFLATQVASANSAVRWLRRWLRRRPWRTTRRPPWNTWRWTGTGDLQNLAAGYSRIQTAPRHGCDVRHLMRPIAVPHVTSIIGFRRLSSRSAALQSQHCPEP